MTFPRTTNAVLGRPSVAKAVLWSLGVHVGAVTATCFSWFVPIDQPSWAGHRRVVQVEASFAAEPSEVPEQIEVAIEREVMPPRPIETDRALRTEPIPVSKSRPPALVQVQPQAIPEELPDLPQLSSELVVRRPEPEELPEPFEATVPKTLSRYEPEVFVSIASVAVEQIAGIDETTPPDFANNQPPAYPPRALAQQIEGTVLLRLHIGASGQVQRVEVVKSSGHEILDEAAAEAVSQWHGRPAYRAGFPQPTVELLPIRFRL